MDSTIFRPADFIQVALDNLERALLLGCILVIGCRHLVLFEEHCVEITLIAIPALLPAGWCSI